jgi:hypothetical protein
VSQRARSLGLSSQGVAAAPASWPWLKARTCWRMGVPGGARSDGRAFCRRWRASRCRLSRRAHRPAGGRVISQIAPVPGAPLMAWRACAMVVAALAVCACSSMPPPHPHVVPASGLASPVPCPQQYAQWRSGPVDLAARRLAAEVRAVRVAVRSEDGASIRTATRPLERTSVALAAAGAMPRCADTEGIYAQLVVGVYQAGADARAAKGMSGLVRAAAALSRAVRIEHQLTAETSRTVHKDSCLPAPHGSRPLAVWPPC